MKRLRRLALMLPLLLASPSHASPAEAQLIRKACDTAVETWTLESRAATTPDQRAKALAHRPDIAKFTKDMWKQIGSSLDQEWTLEPAAWFLRTAPSVLTTQADGSAKMMFTEEIDAIRKAVEAHHLKSAKLIPMCMAMATSKDPRTLDLLEKVASNHPDPKIQGVAALASAMILKSLGDDASIMQKRITALRKAIIQSAEVDLGTTTVAKLAENEIYIITYLTKGRVAPDLTGLDSAGRSIKLSDFKGKVIMLVFWNQTMDQADQVIKITAASAQKFDRRPFVVLGVNNDPLEKLRKLEADDTVPFKSFSDPTNALATRFRVGTWPLVYILDGERKIHYSGAPGSFAELTADALLGEPTPAESK